MRDVQFASSAEQKPPTGGYSTIVGSSVGGAQVLLLQMVDAGPWRRLWSRDGSTLVPVRVDDSFLKAISEPVDHISFTTGSSVYCTVEGHGSARRDGLTFWFLEDSLLVWF